MKEGRKPEYPEKTPGDKLLPRITADYPLVGGGEVEREGEMGVCCLCRSH